jgi:nicotinamidase-related amidase
MHYQKMINPSEIALTLIDFQPAMYCGVESHARLSIMHNVQILAKAAKLFDVPTVLTTVARDSFSGPFMPEVTDLFPGAEIIDRTTINAWLDPNFRRAIEQTQRKRIVLAGLWTEACVMFPALELLAAGYEVFVSTDACGDVSSEAHERAVTRLVQAGAVPMTSLQFLFELQQDWSRSRTYDGVIEILEAHTAFASQVQFSKWALGERGE